MNCEWVAQHIDEYELGLLNRPERADAEAHLASCEACRKRLADAQAADAALRAALAWAEPKPGFAEQVAARASRPARRWWLPAAAVAAAAAAAALLAVALQRSPHTPPPRVEQPLPVPRERAPIMGQLLAGQIEDAYGSPAHSIERGLPYVAATHTAIGMDERSVLLLTRGTEFVPGPDPRERTLAMSVLSGSLLGQIGSPKAEMAIELAPQLGGVVLRSTGCQFYGTGSAPQPVAQWPEEIRVHVLGGGLDLDLGAQKLRLLQGDSAIISGGASAGSTRSLEARIRQLRMQIPEEEPARRRLYQRLSGYFAARLAQLRSTPPGDASPSLDERMAVVEGLFRTHAGALLRIEAEHPEFYELDVAEAELWRLDQLCEEGNQAVDHLLPLIASAW